MSGVGGPHLPQMANSLLGNQWFCGTCGYQMPVGGTCSHCAGGSFGIPVGTTFFGNSVVTIGGPAPRDHWMRADPKVPDTMGWREWLWNAQFECLMSPVQATRWDTDKLVAEHWDEAEVIRGAAGIHALLVPRHWKIIGEFGHTPLGGNSHEVIVTGIVERFGRYVMGTEGWRAEQVVIRELLAPSTEIGLKLEQKYPDVIVHYPDQGESPWTSEKSSALEKGSRSLLPQTQPSPPPPTDGLAQGQLSIQASTHNHSLPLPPNASVNWNPSNPPQGFQTFGVYTSDSAEYYDGPASFFGGLICIASIALTLIGTTIGLLAIFQ